MDMQELLTKAGYNVPKKPSKIDNKQQNLEARFSQAELFIDRAIEKANKVNDAADQEENLSRIESVVLNYQRYCEALKDILLKIYEYKGIQLSENKSLSEVVRKITLIISDIDKKITDALAKVTIRNDAVHDYLNTDYYDETVLEYVLNDGVYYKKTLSLLRDYCINENIIRKML